MSSCPACGAAVLKTDAFCEACDADLVREPSRDGHPPAAERGQPLEQAPPGSSLERAYPALRMNRLRRSSRRHRRAAARHLSEGRPAELAPAAPEPQRTEAVRPPQPSAAQRYVAEELEADLLPPAAGEPAPPADRGVDAVDPDEELDARDLPRSSPFEDHRAPPVSRRRAVSVAHTEGLTEETPLTGYRDAPDETMAPGLRIPRREVLATKTPGSSFDQWQDGREAAGVPEDDGDRGTLTRGGPDLDVVDTTTYSGRGIRQTDPARLSSPKRGNIREKSIAAQFEEDTVLSEMAKAYSRDYEGAEGWNPRALLDSVAYLWNGVKRGAGRRLAVRRLRRELEGRERVRSEQLSELGEVALSLRDLGTPLLEDYRSRLIELHHDQETREEEIHGLTLKIEESRRDQAKAERRGQSTQEELSQRTLELEDKLRPVENEYRSALKTARGAEDDARAMASQVDQARGQLGTLKSREGTGDEVARLKARIERWTREREGILREIPRLEDEAAGLEPEMERLRKEIDRFRRRQRDQRDGLLTSQAEHKREVQRAEGEIERIRVALEGLAGQRRHHFLDCGRQLDIDRPVHDSLEEIYAELDATGTDIRHLGQEIEIAQSKPGAWHYPALTRAGVVLGSIFTLFIIILLVATSSS